MTGPLEPSIDDRQPDPSEHRSPDPSERLRVGGVGSTPVTSVPWPLLFRRRVVDRLEESPRFGWFVLVVALTGMFSVGFTITILGVAIKDIATDFDSTETTVSWVITGPILAFALVGPALGRAGDVFGHRRVYLISLTSSALFAGLIALSWDAPSLIVFRVLGAAGGAATGPSAMAMINRVFEPGRRVQAMGYWSMVGAGAPVLGVVAGGPIVDNYSWRWIFVFQVPVTLLAVLLAAIVLPETSRGKDLGFDVKGALLLGASLGGLLFAVNRAAAWGVDSPVVWLGVTLSAFGLWAFVQVERRAASPLLPPRYLRRRNVAMPMAAQFFLNFAYMGGFIITPLLLQDELAFGYSATRAGLFTIARPLTFAIAGPIMGWLAVRIGERVNATMGAVAVVVSMGMLALGADQLGASWIVAGLALSGFGLGAAVPSLSAAVANAVDEADFGIAGAVQQMTAQIGVVLGIQVMQNLQVARIDDGVPRSFAIAYATGGLIAVVGIFAGALVRSTPRDQRDLE